MMQAKMESNKLELVVILSISIITVVIVAVAIYNSNRPINNNSELLQLENENKLLKSQRDTLNLEIRKHNEKLDSLKVVIDELKTKKQEIKILHENNIKTINSNSIDDNIEYLRSKLPESLTD